MAHDWHSTPEDTKKGNLQGVSREPPTARACQAIRASLLGGELQYGSESFVLEYGQLWGPGLMFIAISG